MFLTNEKTTGGYISGEIKLAITLRLLAGGSNYDLSVLFDIYQSHCNAIMIDVLKNWIIATDIGDINIEKYLHNTAAMSQISEGFS